MRTRSADAVKGADFVFNVAGQVSHLASMQDPLRDLDLNVRSHLAFLETLRREAPTAVVVQTSTRQVYGRPRYLPVDEEHPTAPVDVNGVDKLACEQLHLLYSRHYEMPVSVLRLTNVYGPRQHLERKDLGFLPVFVRQALTGEDIVLYGDGTATSRLRVRGRRRRRPLRRRHHARRRGSRLQPRASGFVDARPRSPG